jgi:hypothetical protein
MQSDLHIKFLNEVMMLEWLWERAVDGADPAVADDAEVEVAAPVALDGEVGFDALVAEASVEAFLPLLLLVMLIERAAGAGEEGDVEEDLLVATGVEAGVAAVTETEGA